MTIVPFDANDLTPRDELLIDIMTELDYALKSDQQVGVYEFAERLVDFMEQSLAFNPKPRVRVKATKEQPSKKLELRPELAEMIEAAKIKYQATN